MIKNPFSEKIDRFLKDYELSSRRSDLIENLKEKGFEGSDAEILSDYKWLCCPVEKTPDPDDDTIREPVPHKPDEPAPDEPDNDSGDDESFKLKKGW